MLLALNTILGYGRQLDKIRTRTSPKIQVQAVKDLIGRLLPERVDEFDITIEPGLFGEENGYFQVKLGEKFLESY